MARPIQRRGATLKLGGREATMTLTATPILRTGVKIYCVNVNIFISNSVHLGNESAPYESEIRVDIRLKAASTLRKQAGQAFEGCKILVQLFVFSTISKLGAKWLLFQLQFITRLIPWTIEPTSRMRRFLSVFTSFKTAKWFTRWLFALKYFIS